MLHHGEAYNLLFLLTEFLMLFSIKAYHFEGCRQKNYTSCISFLLSTYILFSIQNHVLLEKVHLFSHSADHWPRLLNNTQRQSHQLLQEVWSFRPTGRSFKPLNIAVCVLIVNLRLSARWDGLFSAIASLLMPARLHIIRLLASTPNANLVLRIPLTASHLSVARHAGSSKFLSC